MNNLNQQVFEQEMDPSQLNAVYNPYYGGLDANTQIVINVPTSSAPQVDQIDPESELARELQIEAQYEQRDSTTTKICRNCHDSHGTDFIAPCKCTGSIKWVHRRCLDEWRAISPNPDSFQRCDVCKTKYVFKEVPLKHGCCDPRVNTAFLIMLDFVVVFVIWQIMVLFCTLLVWLCDWNRVRDKYFSPDAPHFGIDYLCGLLLFFFVLGIFGIIIGTIKLFQWMCSSGSKEPVNYSYDTYPYYNTWEIWFWLWWFSPRYYYPGYHYHPGIAPCVCVSADCRDCDCNTSGSADCGNCGGKADCGDGAGSALGIALIVVVAIIIVIGVVVGLILMVQISYRIITKRIEVLNRKQKCSQLIVADLSGETV